MSRERRAQQCIICAGIFVSEAPSNQPHDERVSRSGRPRIHISFLLASREDNGIVAVQHRPQEKRAVLRTPRSTTLRTLRTFTRPPLPFSKVSQLSQPSPIDAYILMYSQEALGVREQIARAVPGVSGGLHALACLVSIPKHVDQ